MKISLYNTNILIYYIYFLIYIIENILLRKIKYYKAYNSSIL